jgi:hypothetical protein
MTDRAVAALRTAPVLSAVYAANARNGHRTSHLVVGDAERSMCGVLAGDAAPGVTCEGCRWRWATQTPEGRKTARDAADHAVRSYLAAEAAAAYHRTLDDQAQRDTWEAVARSFEVPEAELTGRVPPEAALLHEGHRP